MSTHRPVRVAIVGGGCAAMATAFELSRPEHRGRFEVTVYQMGFRLGGKGASGRGPAGRIEEHGLHLWMGFYENAFRLMRECYAELDRKTTKPHCPIQDWTQAFEPAPEVAIVDRAPNGDWAPWIASFPAGRGLPGDPPTRRAPFSVRGYLVQTATLVVELVRSAMQQPPAAAPPPWTQRGYDPAGLAEVAARLLRLGPSVAPAIVLEAAQLLALSVRFMNPAPLPGGDFLGPLLAHLGAAAREQLSRAVGGELGPRRIWQVIDVVLASMRGMLAERLAANPRGFDALNDREWLAWLRSHGASEESLQCGFIRGIYDLAFAYEGGDPSRPRLAAGVALRGSMRMFFTYRGALFWRMTAGMGDIVFAPLYEVCRARGVRFEFFHRLREVGVARAHGDSLPHVDSLHFDVQAKVRGGGEYHPLVDVGGLPCWPSEPDYAQLSHGKRLRARKLRFECAHEPHAVGQTSLRVGEDFDMVVLGVGVGAIPHCAAALLEHSPRWRQMMATAATAATRACQLWMREDMSSLGWRHPQINLSGYVEPFDTWADMRHLIPREGWEPGQVRSIAYLVSVLPEPARAPGESAADYEGRCDEEVRRAAIDFLERDVSGLWPRAVSPTGGFRWSVLVSPDEADGAAPAEGEARFDSQFWLANVNPSDRYSLSVPGSVAHRISPLDLDFDNLTVAGDWTASGLDSGCVESAVMSGLLAAHALSQSPPLEAIVGYDHP